MTIIKPSTLWFDVVEVPEQYSDTISNFLDRVWLTRYQKLYKIISYNRSELKIKFTPCIKYLIVQ